MLNILYPELSHSFIRYSNDIYYIMYVHFLIVSLRVAMTAHVRFGIRTLERSYIH